MNFLAFTVLHSSVLSGHSVHFPHSEAVSPISQSVKSSRSLTSPNLDTPESSLTPAQDSRSPKLGIPDWSKLIGKDVYYQYVSDWKMETFGGQKKNVLEKKITRMKVRETKEGRASVLFWDDASRTEPSFAGWISTEVSTSLPAMDIEAEPIYILGAQLRGRDFSMMRERRLGGTWAKEFDPKRVMNANDIVPYYGLQFGQERAAGDSYSVLIDRPTSFFGGDNTLATISVKVESQPDNSWILNVILDSSGAQDKRLGYGKVRLRYGADGLLRSFADSYKGEMQIEGVKGDGTVKWSITRVATAKG